MCNENTWNIVSGPSGPVWVMLPSWTSVPNASSLRFCWVKCFDPKSSCEFVLFFFANNPWNQTDLYLREWSLFAGVNRERRWRNKVFQRTKISTGGFVDWSTPSSSNRLDHAKIVTFACSTSTLYSMFMHFHAGCSIFDISLLYVLTVSSWRSLFLIYPIADVFSTMTSWGRATSEISTHKKGVASGHINGFFFGTKEI